MNVESYVRRRVELVSVTPSTATCLLDGEIIGEVQCLHGNTWRFRSRFGGYGDCHGRLGAIGALIDLQRNR